MHYRLVAIAATVQVLIICALLIALAVRKAIGPALMQRRLRHERIVLEMLSAWLAGEVSPEHLQARLLSADSKAVANVIRKAAAGIEGERWSELVDHVRRSRCFFRMRAQARSRLWWRRLAGARCLEILANCDDLPLINELLRDRDRRVRLAAVAVLRRIADTSALANVLETALTANPILQGYLFSCLQHHRIAMSALLPDAMRDSTTSDRKCAILRLMAQLGDPAHLDAVARYANAPSVPLRCSCAKALASFPHSRSSDALRHLLEDEDENVRAAAAASLGRLRAVEACDALGRRLTDDCRAVRLNAGLALRLLGSSGSRALRAGPQGHGCIDPELPRYILGLSDAAVHTLTASSNW